MGTAILAIVCLLTGALLGGFLVWLLMSIAIVGDALDEAPGSEDFLREPVELERRSISRWSGPKVLP